MNQFWLIGFSELVFLIVMALLFLLYRIWRRKKSEASQIESLLTEVSSSAVERKKKLTRHLTSKRGVEAGEAEKLTEEMLQIERQFLQFFIKFQYDQGLGAEFYTHLTEMLDQYLKLIPKNNPVPTPISIENIAKILPEQSGVTLVSKTEALAVIETPLETTELLDEYVDAPLKSKEEIVQNNSVSSLVIASESVGQETDTTDLDWADAFEEAGNIMEHPRADEVKPLKILDSELGDTSEIPGADLDWNDAFAEEAQSKK